MPGRAPREDDWTLWWRRLTDVWPRAVYRWNERRFESRRSEFVLRLINLAVVLGGAAALGAVSALISVLFRGSAVDGFWIGATAFLALSALAVLYLCWGGVREWLRTRRSR